MEDKTGRTPAENVAFMLDYSARCPAAHRVLLRDFCKLHAQGIPLRDARLADGQNRLSA